MWVEEHLSEVQRSSPHPICVRVCCVHSRTAVVGSPRDPPLSPPGLIRWHAAWASMG